MLPSAYSDPGLFCCYDEIEQADNDKTESNSPFLIHTYNDRVPTDDDKSQDIC